MNAIAWAIFSCVLFFMASGPRAQIVWSNLRCPGGAFAHDSVRDLTVCFGNGQTWEFDGVLWMRRWPAVSPPANSSGVMEFDVARNRSVLVLASGQTWTWDGLNWLQHTAGMQPTGVSSHLPGAMTYHAARQRVMWIGGVGPAMRLWEWSGSSWTQVSWGGPTMRHSTALAYDPLRQVVVLFGGYSFSTGGVFSDTWEWNGASWTQLFPSVQPAARGFHAFAYDPSRQRVVLAGGNSTAAFGDSWEWDGASWVAVAPVPYSGAGHALVYEGAAQRMRLIEGSGRGVSVLMAGAWSPLLGWPPAMSGHAAAYDDVRSRIVVCSGGSEVHEWDGSRWWHLTGSTGPLPRIGHAIVFDAHTGRSLLFGGTGVGVFNDLWSWDGSVWSSVPSSSGPVARHDHAMAYDDARNRVVLFGGLGASGHLGDTWEWDGVQWLASFPSVAPPPRRAAAMAFDRMRGRIVLFGGSLGLPIGDTWEWDGVSWVMRSSALQPPARQGHAMVYNGVRERIELFGGASLMSELADTWEWDGMNWFNRTTSGPAARRDHVMVYDAARAQSFVFGGRQAADVDDAWSLAPLQATAATFGAGCGTPPLSLSPDPAARPIMGQIARASLTDMPTPAAAVAMGFSKSTFGAYPLPVTLAGIGMPGCMLYQSSDIMGLAVSLLGGGSAEFSLAIPNQSSLLGGRLFLQAYAYAPGQNPLEVISSNALEWLLNNR